VWARGLATGALVTSALLGVAYALSQVGAVSFFPLDIAQAGVRLTPGEIATQGIEALGPGAKLLAETTALVLVLLAGAGAGGVVLRFGLQRSWSNILPLAAATIALIALAQTIAGTLPDAISLAGTAVLIVGWAAILLATLRRVCSTARAAIPTRREFLRLSASLLVAVAAGGGVVGEVLRRSQETALAQAIARGDPVPGVPLATSSKVIFPVADPAFQPAPAARPEATPLPALYVVSSEVRSPNVDTTKWQLSVGGLVDTPLTLSYADLQSLDRVDQPSTLTCISNEVGGGLIGTGVWSGVALSTLLDRAGISQAASMVVVRSVTGYSDAIPLDRALDSRSLVAYGFSGQALTQEHGFPARLIVPGLYGMKNVKWLSGIEVVDSSFNGYWEQRGWDPSADVRTQSTIDTGNPSIGNANHIRLDNGLVVLGGYAFAGIRGISSVELNIDSSGWQPVQLKEAGSDLTDLTWRPWRYVWQPAAGGHVVTVRATDGSGLLQSAESLPPHPSGASGWHTLRLQVDA
jgi:DMSO/TMAO reductase YedYZ molybdopterin-dependent catalytic subunit